MANFYGFNSKNAAAVDDVVVIVVVVVDNVVVVVDVVVVAAGFGSRPDPRVNLKTKRESN